MFEPLPTAAAPDLTALANRRKRARETDEALDVAQFPDSSASSVQAQRRELLMHVAKGYLELKQDAGHRARDENMVSRATELHPLALGMVQSIHNYDSKGKDSKPNAPGFRGHPWGKRPDAMMKAFIVRIMQLLEVEDKKVKLELQALEPSVRVALENAISLISETAARIVSSSSGIGATRCFRIIWETDDTLFGA